MKTQQLMTFARTANCQYEHCGLLTPERTQGMTLVSTCFTNNAEMTQQRVVVARILSLIVLSLML